MEVLVLNWQVETQIVAECLPLRLIDMRIQRGVQLDRISSKPLDGKDEQSDSKEYWNKE